MLNKLCFVITPFGRTPKEKAQFSAVFTQIIAPVLSCHGYLAFRADSEPTIGDFMRSKVIPSIFNADLAIADMTNGNANAFYELGIRHALHPCGTILMKHEDAVTPADLERYFSIRYNLSLESLSQAKDTLYGVPAAKRGNYTLRPVCVFHSLSAVDAKEQEIY